MDTCLFCDCDLTPGSEEHVFLSMSRPGAAYRTSCASYPVRRPIHREFRRPGFQRLKQRGTIQPAGRAPSKAS